MHVTTETFFTIVFRQWEASQACNELAALLNEGGVDLEDYPALDTLFGAINHISGGEITTEVVPDHEPAQETVEGETE